MFWLKERRAAEWSGSNLCSTVLAMWSNTSSSLNLNCFVSETGKGCSAYLTHLPWHSRQPLSGPEGSWLHGVQLLSSSVIPSPQVWAGSSDSLLTKLWDVTWGTKTVASISSSLSLSHSLASSLFSREPAVMLRAALWRGTHDSSQQPARTWGLPRATWVFLGANVPRVVPSSIALWETLGWHPDCSLLRKPGQRYPVQKAVRIPTTCAG